MAPKACEQVLADKSHVTQVWWRDRSKGSNQFDVPTILNETSMTAAHDLSIREHLPCRRSCATLPWQCIWLASSFGACNEMPEVPARKHGYGEVLRGMCCSAAPNL